jgi:hypothetical protein
MRDSMMDGRPNAHRCLWLPRQTTGLSAGGLEEIKKTKGEEVAERARNDREPWMSGEKREEEDGGACEALGCDQRGGFQLAD